MNYRFHQFGLFAASFVSLALFAQGCARTEPSTSTISNSAGPVEAKVQSADEKNEKPSINALAVSVAEEQVDDANTTVTDTADDKTADPRKVADEPKNSSQPQAGEKEYSDEDLHKNKTLLVLAFQPDIRADYLIQTVRFFIDDDQARQAKKIAASYNWRYEELLKQRAAILENAMDEIDVKGQLRRIRIKTVELSKEIRQRITAEILTDEQRQRLKDRYRKD